ncbi:hypothetical protein [Aeromonas caviae]|uniref:hypothetical protein n=1 Tax=Aeromonas caviae TaxID=648 RepID=UPI0029D77356|nr:hypothetical protein [Aeromonas caviae]MDX7711784.1 hypothetical protein [Aeromonas caviae]
MKKIILVALALAAPVIEAKGAVVVARPVVISRPAVVSAPTPKPVIVAKSSSSKASKTGKPTSTVVPIIPPATSSSDECEKKTLRCE